MASGLQRIGRAGHQVGEISRGVLFPKHRTDLIGCAVSVQRMLAGQIETMRVPANPLDVLAQHTVAACALEPLSADVWFDVVRRSAVRHAAAQRVRGHPGSAVRQVPVHRFRRTAAPAGLRPGHRHADRPPGRAAAGRHLRRRHPGPRDVHRVPGHRVRKAFAGRRTRRGDGLRVAARRCHLAGRDQLAHHRDHPRPGAGRPGSRQPARLPFWRGDDAGRPAELGQAVGRFTGELAGMDRDEFEKRCAELGFADYAVDNLWQLLDDQRTATKIVPSDTTLLVERFRDELGDWRVVLHSPYGLKVHGPLALAVSRRLLERYGIDEKPTASDDGIVVRLPDTEDTRPGPSCSCSSPTRSSRWSPERSADRPVRLPVPGVRGAGAAAAPPPSRQALPAVASTPARLATARRGPQVSGFPDRAGDGAGVPAGRLRRPDADRVDGAHRATPGAGARGRDTDAVAVRGLAAVRLRRGVHVRGRQPAGRTPAAALSLDSTLLAELLGRVELRELLDRR